MRNRKLVLPLLIAAALVAPTVLAPRTAEASEEGRRNTAYALGAATAYFIINKRPTEALIGAGATAYAAKLLQDDINARHRREKARAVNNARRSSSRSSSSSSSRQVVYRSSGFSRAEYDKAISSAYQKGIKAGYEKGVSEGYKSGLRASRTPTVRPSSTESPTYNRVLLARR